jgi:hypothetical protein
MPENRSVNVSGDAVSNAIIVGDHNNVDATTNAKFTKITLPPAGTVGIAKECAQVRAILQNLSGEHAGKIGRALDDAAEEASKPKPDKDEVGAALSRALNYAKTGNAFADQVEKLAPHIANVVAWLGSNWHKLLPLVGLAL